MRYLTKIWGKKGKNGVSAVGSLFSDKLLDLEAVELHPELELSGEQREQMQVQHKQSQQQVYLFVVTQLLATVALFVVLLVFDLVVAYSSLLGGLIATLANAWFAQKVFRLRPSVTADKMLAAFYVGEIYKIVLTCAMFIIVFVTVESINAAALLITYLFIHMTPAVQNVLTKD